MNIENKKTLIYGLGLAGNVTGIIVGKKRGNGFWGCVGWMLLGGLAGAAVGYIATAMLPTEEEKSVTLTIGT